MALDALFDSKFLYEAHSWTPSEGSVQSSSSDHLFKKHDQYQAVLDSPVGNNVLRTTGMSNLNMDVASNKDTTLILEEGLDVKASSLIRGGPLGFPNDLQMYGNTSTNKDCFFINGSFIAQNTPQITPKGPCMNKKTMQSEALAANYCPASQNHQSSLLAGFNKETLNFNHKNKKPRMDIEEESNIYQNIVQHQRQSPLFQTLHHNQKLQISNEQNFLNSGVCSRRLMQFMYHLRNRPLDNGLAYWRKFVAEYYAPGAKKRLCVSLYDKVEVQNLGVFPHKAMDAGHCDLCGSKSSRGFEAKYEVLPRLYKLTYDNGVIDELLYVDMPLESRLPSGLTVLEYGKAVQETVYAQLRVVHEGQLRLVFSHDYKLLSWDFCANCHEVFLPRNTVASQLQVTEVLHAAQKYQSLFHDGRSDGVSSKDLLANCNLIQEAGFSLAKTFALQSIHDFGFSKRYTQFLQIAEIVDSMKDLMTFCLDNHFGPIKGLKNYSGENGRAKFTKESQEMRNLTGVQDSQLDNDKMMARSCGFSSNGCSKAPETISEQYYASSCADCYQNSTKENSLIIPTVNTATQRSRFSKQKASSNQIQSLKTRSLSERNQITEHGIIRKILQEMINDSKTVKKDERGDNEVGDSLAKVWKTEMGENNYMRYEKRNNIITEDTANFYSPVPENLFDLDGWQAWPG